jgi:hypothetical protein
MPKKPTEQQLANLRKGFEALKEKRKKKEEEEDKPPVVVPVVAQAPEPVPEPVAVPKPKPERKKRVAFDPEAFKTSLLTELRVPPVEKIVEKPVEKIVEKVVFKERLMTGSELLNRVFNF